MKMECPIPPGGESVDPVDCAIGWLLEGKKREGFNRSFCLQNAMACIEVAIETTERKVDKPA